MIKRVALNNLTKTNKISEIYIIFYDLIRIQGERPHLHKLTLIQQRMRSSKLCCDWFLEDRLITIFPSLPKYYMIHLQLNTLLPKKKSSISDFKKSL